MALTSIVVGLLLEKERLRLDDEIQKYVPAFPKKPWPVTLRRLMAHQAGIRRDGGDEEPLSERCARRSTRWPALRSARVLRAGHAVRYTTYGWILVSAAVEAAAISHSSASCEPRFPAAGPGRHGAGVRTKASSNVATFYYPRFAGDTRYGPEDARPGDYNCFAGAGAFLSTPSDLVRFGRDQRDKLLSPPPSRCCRHRSGWLPAQRPGMASAGSETLVISRANPRGRSAMTANTSSAARRR